MELREEIKRLEKSKNFKDFMKSGNYYLVHAFTMIVNKQHPWQLGYYSRESDKVSVFEMGSKITKAPEDDVLKKKKEGVEKLDMKKVKMEPEGALKVAEGIKKEKHSGETVTRTILILQNLEGEITYNMTLVTSNFNIINIKVSAETGQVLKETKQSILKLGKPA